MTAPTAATTAAIGASGRLIAPATIERPAVSPGSAMMIIPTMVRIGPSAATSASATATTVCMDGSSSLNHVARSPTNPATAWMAGASAVPSAMDALSIAPSMFSIAHDSSPFCAAAIVSAAVASWVASVYFASPSAPCVIMTAAARLASLPKMVCMAASRCASDKPPSFVCSSAAISLALRMWPSWSRTCKPSSATASAALSVGAARRCSMVFRLVPASEPCMPASANMPRTAAVSWISHPTRFACAEHWDMACVRSATSADEAFADPASAFAMTLASPAASPNAPID